MLDADHFKAYNDQYGHPAGDEVLRTVAGCIRKAARRPTDLAARYGGEEFAMLLPGSDAIGAAGVAEAIREAVAALNLPHAGSPTGFVTVSIGVAAIMPALAEGSAVLLRMADRALYDAKRQGRNHVAIAGAESEKPAVPAG